MPFQIRVNVLDENDNSPAFDRHIYQGSIYRSPKHGSFVNLGNLIKVNDPDLGDKIELKLLGKASTLFNLEPDSGRVSFSSNKTRTVLPLEKIYLRIRATDLAGHITESQLVIHVLDTILDKAPEIRGVAIIDSRFVKLLSSSK